MMSYKNKENATLEATIIKGGWPEQSTELFVSKIATPRDVGSGPLVIYKENWIKKSDKDNEHETGNQK